MHAAWFSIPHLDSGYATQYCGHRRICVYQCMECLRLRYCFITDKAKYTLPLALNVFQGEYGTDYGKLAAGCVIALIPVVVIFAFIQSISPVAQPPVRSRAKAHKIQTLY